MEREPSGCLSAFPGLFCHQGIRLFVCVRGTKEEKGKDPILAIPALSHNAATSIWRVSALEEFKEYCFKVNTISDARTIHYINRVHYVPNLIEKLSISILGCAIWRICHSNVQKVKDRICLPSCLYN